MELCFPAQIRAVLNHPAWQGYSIEELCRMGVNGVRGLRPGMKQQRKQQTELEAATRRASAADRLREMSLETNREQFEAERQSLLDEFL